MLDSSTSSIALQDDKIEISIQKEEAPEISVQSSVELRPSKEGNIFMFV